MQESHLRALRRTAFHNSVIFCSEAWYLDMRPQFVDTSARFQMSHISVIAIDDDEGKDEPYLLVATSM